MTASLKKEADHLYKLAQEGKRDEFDEYVDALISFYGAISRVGTVVPPPKQPIWIPQYGYRYG